MDQSHFTLCLKDGTFKPFPRPSLMGIINMSPNSFYQPMKNVFDALKTAEAMTRSGAAIIDVGGEATNPFVQLEKESPNLQEEMDRVLPLIEAIKKNMDVLVSVDTSQPAVMKEAIKHGADMINDQRALQCHGAKKTVSELNVPVCLMHSFDFVRQPGTCDKKTLLSQIKNDLKKIMDDCFAHGIRKDRLIIDPGFGQGHYGKNTEENFYLLAHLNEFNELGSPILVGWSRKSMIGAVLNNASPSDRLYASLASASIAAYLGASILRVHDVSETMDAIKVINHIQSAICE